MSFHIPHTMKASSVSLFLLRGLLLCDGPTWRVPQSALAQGEVQESRHIPALALQPVQGKFLTSLGPQVLLCKMGTKVEPVSEVLGRLNGL